MTNKPKHFFLRAWRKRRNVKLPELARRAGIPRSTIARYESEYTSPTLAVMLTLARALGVGVEQLLAQPPAPPTETTTTKRRRRP